MSGSFSCDDAEGCAAAAVPEPVAVRAERLFIRRCCGATALLDVETPLLVETCEQAGRAIFAGNKGHCCCIAMAQGTCCCAVTCSVLEGAYNFRVDAMIADASRPLHAATHVHAVGSVASKLQNCDCNSLLFISD